MSERIAIVGVGLIGGSFGLALKAAGHEGERVGIGRDPGRLQQAVERGAVDRVETDAAAGVAGADVVLLAVPMGAMRASLEAIRPGLGAGAVVTDAGSTKRSFVDDARAVLGSLERVVPGHPVAGTERSGVAAAFPELFRDRRVILTPDAETDPDAITLVERLWGLAGARVERLGVDDHDRLLAATSHLPHMLAFGLVDALARDPEADALFRYAAGGFRDFTRIASSDPVMWSDICIANRGPLLRALEAYRADLDALTAEVRSGDAEGLRERFTRAKTARDRYCE
ncbi:MAG: prephenate dehydrogenase/arogenate dehydrogenase family protein [Halofilum sp. (in: g-proteobacteria)]|nr:prephenate dehydrogenase/arogenate dehydrogenase family protein [Halofilum sp. (in: g-proteobacteria)]